MTKTVVGKDEYGKPIFVPAPLDEPDRGWVFGDCHYVETAGGGERWISVEAERKRKFRANRKEES